jgi:hypothetical protein
MISPPCRISRVLKNNLLFSADSTADVYVSQMANISLSEARQQEHCAINESLLGIRIDAIDRKIT